jgi:aquaporin Z
MEAVWTFLLATVVLQTATTETQAGNSFFGLSIGMTVVAGAITAGRTSPFSATAFLPSVFFLIFCIPAISGGVFNPAVGTGILTVRFLFIF